MESALRARRGRYRLFLGGSPVARGRKQNLFGCWFKAEKNAMPGSPDVPMIYELMEKHKRRLAVVLLSPGDFGRPVIGPSWYVSRASESSARRIRKNHERSGTLSRGKKTRMGSQRFACRRTGGPGARGCRATARSYRTDEKTVRELDGGESSQSRSLYTRPRWLFRSRIRPPARLIRASEKIKHSLTRIKQARVKIVNLIREYFGSPCDREEFGFHKERIRP
jgi:hypothetical protein